jgi:mannose-6-phosphate isomerase
MLNNYKVDYDQVENQSNQMVSCPYFTTNYINLNTVLHKDNHHDSFVIYICVEGEANIIYKDVDYSLNAGETVLLPAILKTYQISAKQAKLLEVYV